jgi:hypothetical protein
MISNLARLRCITMITYQLNLAEIQRSFALSVIHARCFGRKSAMLALVGLSLLSSYTLVVSTVTTRS